MNASKVFCIGAGFVRVPSIAVMADRSLDMLFKMAPINGGGIAQRDSRKPFVFERTLNKIGP